MVEACWNVTIPGITCIPPLRPAREEKTNKNVSHFEEIAYNLHYESRGEDGWVVVVMVVMVVVVVEV